MADYTVEQLRAAAQRAHAAGDFAAAKKLIARGMAMSAAQPQPQPQPQVGSPTVPPAADDPSYATPTPEQVPAHMQDDGQTTLPYQVGSGINEGIASTLGMPVDMLSGAANMAARGLGLPEIERPVGGSEQIADMLTRGQMIDTTQPQTAAQRIGRRVGQDVGAGATFAPAARALPAARNAMGPLTGREASGVVASGVGSGLAGGATAEVTDNPTANVVASLAGGVAGSFAGAGRNAARRRPATTSEDLHDEGRAAYDALKTSDVRLPVEQMGELRGSIMSRLVDERAVARSGRVRNAAAKKFFREFDATVRDSQGGPVPAEDLLALRQAAGDMATSADGETRRVGKIVRQALDDFGTQSGVPELAEGARMHAMAFKTAEIERIEDAIRQGRDGRAMFRTLHNQIKRGSPKQKGWSEEEIEAIRRGAEGGSVRKVLEFLGKHANVGGQLVGGSAGLVAGGPAGAVVGSLAARGAGATMRGGASKLTEKQAATVKQLLAQRAGIKAGHRSRRPTQAQQNVLAALLARTEAGQE